MLGTALAWLVARTDLPGRQVARLLLQAPAGDAVVHRRLRAAGRLRPGELLAGLLEPLGVGQLPALEEFWGALYVLTLFTYPYVYLPVVAAWASSGVAGGERPAARPQPGGGVPDGGGADPRAVCGRGRCWSSSTTISDFGAVQLLRCETLTSSIYASRVFDRAGALAQSLLLGLLAVAVVAGERSATRAGRGRAGRLATEARALRVPLGRWRAAALALVGGVVALALVAPVGVLVFWAVRGLFHGSLRAGRWSPTRARWPGRRSTPPPWPWPRRPWPWPRCCRWPT